MRKPDKHQRPRRSATACLWVCRVFAALYLVALALFLIGTFGLFGQARDPLAGVFLMPLGLPWVLWTGGFPDPWLPWLAALAPLLNLAILRMLCRFVHTGRNDRQSQEEEGSDAF